MSARSDLHLVTGGSGFFGSILVEYLRQRGQRVRVLDLFDNPRRHGDVEFVQGDIRDQKATTAACAGVACVHHNVAQVPLAKDEKLFWSVNCDGTEILLKCCLDAGVAKVVHMSSSAVFGVPERNPVDDQVAPRPREAYGRSKLKAEEICRRFVEGGLDVTIVRPRTILGPGRLGVMQILFEWIRRGQSVPVFDGGRNVYQFVHADDLAEACLRAASLPGPNVFNVGAEEYGTMTEMLAALIRHAGTGSRIVSVPLRLAESGMEALSWLGVSPLARYHSLMYGRSFYFDLSRTKRELSWSAAHSNADMLCQSYDWYLQSFEDNRSDVTRSRHQMPVKQGVLAAAGLFLQLLPPLNTDES